YYDLNLKKTRLKILKENKKNFIFKKIDLNNYNKLDKLFKELKINYVVNLAAQAGVRHSISNPKSYFQSNIAGFFNIIELSNKYKILHFVSASTSSVYGSQEKFPLKEEFITDSPLSFYAASKKTNEILGYSYSNIHKLPVTFLRFFTVYGTYGRPDMSLFIFTKKILKNQFINLHNKGNHVRDFTHVSDITNSIIKIINKQPSGKIPFDIFNIGNNKPIELKYFLYLIEKYTNKKAKIKYLKMQKGDVYKTHSSIAKIEKKIEYKPKMNIENGVKEFVDWFREYHNI
ncbi:GDP-mannose 4,6-dehydratase, partial [Alphaproteobacteria bacterium]|nr:GDP-mannose 4,6-dehydratase [Alphaproteobacteria bacterium]